MDKDTGYAAPTGIEFKWAGERKDGKGKTSAKVTVDKLGVEQGQGGLIEKVDVLAEIPYVIRKGFSMATGTKPYIYQVSSFSNQPSHELLGLETDACALSVPQPYDARGGYG